MACVYSFSHSNHECEERDHVRFRDSGLVKEASHQESNKASSRTGSSGTGSCGTEGTLSNDIELHVSF